MTLEGELLQWPFLERILVPEYLDREASKALLLVNGERETFEHRVHHLGRRAHEFFNGKIGSGLRIILQEPFVDGVSRVLRPA